MAVTYGNHTYGFIWWKSHARVIRPVLQISALWPEIRDHSITCFYMVVGLYMEINMLLAETLCCKSLLFWPVIWLVYCASQYKNFTISESCWVNRFSEQILRSLVMDRNANHILSWASLIFFFLLEGFCCVESFSFIWTTSNIWSQILLSFEKK